MRGERLQLEHHRRRELGPAHRVRAQTWARRGDVLALGRSTPLGALTEGLMGWAGQWFSLVWFFRDNRVPPVFGPPSSGSSAFLTSELCREVTSTDQGPSAQGKASQYWTPTHWPWAMSLVT